MSGKAMNNQVCTPRERVALEIPFARFVDGCRVPTGRDRGPGSRFHRVRADVAAPTMRPISPYSTKFA